MSKKMLLKIVCLLWNLIMHLLHFFVRGATDRIEDGRKVHGRGLGEGELDFYKPTVLKEDQFLIVKDELKIDLLSKHL
jgi:hypothetical protein